MMKRMRCLPIGNKGFISIYALIVLQVVLMAISLFSLRITTLQSVERRDSPIDLYILRSIKAHAAKREADENIVVEEEPMEEETTTHWQELYHGQRIVFTRSENEIEIRYQHHTIVCMLNDDDEIMSYEYI